MTDSELLALVRSYDVGEITRAEFQARARGLSDTDLLKVSRILDGRSDREVPIAVEARNRSQRVIRFSALRLILSGHGRSSGVRR